MNELSKLFKGLSATFSLIPGLGMLILSTGIPPGENNYLYGGVSTIVGSISLILLLLYKNQIEVMASRKVVKLTILFFIFGFILFFSYGYFYSITVLSSNYWEESFFRPFWADGRLSEELSIWQGSWTRLYDNHGPASYVDLKAQSSKLPFIITRLILISTFSLSIISFTLSFGLSGIKLKSSQ